MRVQGRALLARGSLLLELAQLRREAVALVTQQKLGQLDPPPHLIDRRLVRAPPARGLLRGLLVPSQLRSGVCDSRRRQQQRRGYRRPCLSGIQPFQWVVMAVIFGAIHIYSD